MIRYNHGRWGLLFVFQARGSVFPKALCIAIPAAALAGGMNILKTMMGLESSVSTSAVMTSFASFISVLGFMVVFRSNLAYNRYWEGAALVQEVRGEWFNVASSLFAFSSRKPEDKEKVQTFQNLIVRLISLLYGTALTTVSGSHFDVLDFEGIDADSMDFLESASREVKCEIIMQWVQRSIVDNIGNGVLPIAPPILSRVFQELSGGVVNIAAARKINELPFPFHYAQMLSVLLQIYSFGVPCAAGYVMESWWGAAGSTFFNVFVLWAVNYLAVEIEAPFGTAANHLPIDDEMNRMNNNLLMLVQDKAQTPPTYQQTSLTSDPRIMHEEIEEFSAPSARGSGRRGAAAAGKVVAPASVAPHGPDPCLAHQLPMAAEVPIIVSKSKAPLDQQYVQAQQHHAATMAYEMREPKDKDPPPRSHSVARRAQSQTEEKIPTSKDSNRAFRRVQSDRLRRAASPAKDDAEVESCSDDEKSLSSQYMQGGSRHQQRFSGTGKPPVPPLPSQLPTHHPHARRR